MDNYDFDGDDDHDEQVYYVADGVSPHSKIRSSTKRKKLDWLTDLSRKITPNSQNKMRRIK